MSSISKLKAVSPAEIPAKVSEMTVNELGARGFVLVELALWFLFWGNDWTW